MAAASRPSTPVKETENNNPSLEDSGQGLRQEQGQRYVLELPSLDLTIDLGDWTDGHEKGHGENTTGCSIYNEPLNKNDNISDSETAVRRPEPSNGNDSLPETPPPRGFPIWFPGTLEAARGSVRSTTDGNTSDLEIPVERPCDYVLNKNSVPRWLEQRKSFPTWQQVQDEPHEHFAEKDERIYIISLDYLAAFIAESSMLLREFRNLDVNQELRRQELEKRIVEVWKRVAVPIRFVKQLSEELYAVLTARSGEDLREKLYKWASES